MRKILIACVSIIALTACSYSEANPLPSSAVRIETYSAIGSGTKISDNRVLTAAHVVVGETHITIIDENGNSVPAKIIAIDTSTDLALLEAHPDTEISSVDCAISEIGTEFKINGNPLEMTFIHSWGRIASSPRPLEFIKSGYIVNSTLIMGDSGAGAIDKYGNLIGVVSAIIPAMLKTGKEVLPKVPSVTGFGVIVDGPTICEFLEKDA